MLDVPKGTEMTTANFTSAFFNLLDTPPDLAAVDNFALDHQAALDALDDQVSASGWTPTQLSASRIVLSSGAFDLTISGSGISPISSISELEDAIFAGLAQGTFDGISVTRSGTEILSFRMSSSAYTLSSGNQSFQVDGALLNSFAQFYALVGALSMLSDMANLSSQELNSIYATLDDYAISGVSILDGGTELAALSLTPTQLGVTLDGYSLTVDGTAPEDFAEVVEIAQAFATGAVDLTTIPNLAVDGITFKDPDGTTLAKITGPIENEASFDNATLKVDGVKVPDIWLSEDLVFNGGKSGERVYGLHGKDRISGNGGGDELFGLSQNDVLRGNGGNDKLFGGGGADRLEGGNGRDRLYGDNGTDKLDGGAGKDKLFGGAKRDVLFGRGGDDLLRGDTGNDKLFGGAGADTFFFSKGDGKDTIKDFTLGEDLIQIGRGASHIGQLDFDKSGSDVIISFRNVEITVEDIRLGQLDDVDNFLF
jgi:Ca2+-binding RTX toxin-like protein|tara:strand:- start:665 stop:2110 length:1446 start_codon:yes stop_codon:yes gene_type:complete